LSKRHSERFSFEILICENSFLGKFALERKRLSIAKRKHDFFYTNIKTCCCLFSFKWKQIFYQNFPKCRCLNFNEQVFNRHKLNGFILQSHILDRVPTNSIIISQKKVRIFKSQPFYAPHFLASCWYNLILIRIIQVEKKIALKLIGSENHSVFIIHMFSTHYI